MWEKWFETVKLAITAKENIQVEKLLRPRPQNADLDYPHEPHLDIQYQSPGAESDSDEEPLATKRAPTAQKRKTICPIKIVPDKLSITFGDKTSVLVKSRNQVARKTIMRRVKEPRGTLKPLWNIIPDGTITNYTPHTITIDTPKRKDTVIRKSDIAIATEAIPNKPRLIDFVACKTVGEYNRNREKIKFYLDEKKQKEKWAAEQSTQQQDEPQPGTSRQTQQAATKPTKKHTTTKQKQRKGKAGSPRRKPQQSTKRTHVPQFEAKSKQAALAQSKLEQAKRRQQRYSSIVSTDLDRWNNSDTVEVINLVSYSLLQSPITIVTSSSPKDFMHTPNKGRGSVERIVQKLPINKDNMKETPSAPVRNIEQLIQQKQNTSTEPTRAIQQQQPTITQISHNIDDEVPVTILIESDSDHNIMPEEPLTAPMTAAQEPQPTEPTRIANKDTNISIEHSLSDDERCRNPDHSDSPQSSYSTAPSEIPHRTTLEQSPISSLDPEDVDHLNHIFDI